MLVAQLLLPATTGSAGAPLGRAAANGTIAAALPGNSMGYRRRIQDKGRKGSHGNHEIDSGDSNRHYGAGCFFHFAVCSGKLAKGISPLPCMPMGGVIINVYKHTLI